MNDEDGGELGMEADKHDVGAMRLYINSFMFKNSNIDMREQEKKEEREIEEREGICLGPFFNTHIFHLFHE